MPDLQDEHGIQRYGFVATEDNYHRMVARPVPDDRGLYTLYSDHVSAREADKARIEELEQQLERAHELYKERISESIEVRDARIEELEQTVTDMLDARVAQLVESRATPSDGPVAEKPEQTRWFDEGQWWVADGVPRLPKQGDKYLTSSDSPIPLLAKQDHGVKPNTVDEPRIILRPAKSFMCSDGIERQETGEVRRRVPKGTWILWPGAADGPYQVTASSQTSYGTGYPILAPVSMGNEETTLTPNTNPDCCCTNDYTCRFCSMSDKDAEIERLRDELKAEKDQRARAVTRRDDADRYWRDKIESLARQQSMYPRTKQVLLSLLSDTREGETEGCPADSSNEGYDFICPGCPECEGRPTGLLSGDALGSPGRDA